MMKASHLLLITQMAIGAALAASAALYVHYLDPVASEFCGLDSGCEAVRRTPVAYFGSRFVSLPLFAMLAYGALLALSLRCDPSAPPSTARGNLGSTPPGALEQLRQNPAALLFAASGLGGVCALALIAYQAFGLGQFCWLCLIVDCAALLAASTAFGFALLQRTPHRRSAALVTRAPLVATAVWLVAGPLIWSAVQPAPAVPAGVQQLYKSDKINVIEFADFECPYCRKLHAILSPLLDEYGDAVHFVRLHKPLARHPMAEQAARAAICATAQRRGEPMANRLFLGELSSASIAKAAVDVGLDPKLFTECLLDPATDRKLRKDAGRISEEEFKGLPTTYIGQKLLVGVRSEAAYRDALDRARTIPATTLSGPAFLSFWGLLLLGVWGFFWRSRRSSPGSASASGDT